MDNPFLGSSICTVSKRGQINLSQNFVETIWLRKTRHRLYIGINDGEDCLIVFDDPCLQRLCNITEEPQYLNLQTGAEREDILRRAFGFVAKTQMNDRGQLPIAPWMRACLDNSLQTLVVGKGDHFEIWNLIHALERDSIVTDLARLHLNRLPNLERRHGSVLPFVKAPRRRGDMGKSGLLLHTVLPMRPRHDPIGDV